MNPTKTKKMIVLLAAAATLSACGGGGGGGGETDTTVADVVDTTPAPSYDNDHLLQVNQPAAIDAGFDGSGVEVAVLDSGVDQTHDEFSETTFNTGYNVADGNTDTSDVSSHGTRVAGLVAGKNVGVATGASITSVRIVKEDETFTSNETAAGINWTVDTTTAKIMNLSSTLDNTGSMVDALNTMAAEDRLLIAAAGNEADANANGYVLLDDPYVDAGTMDHIISVGAVDDNNQIASFSDRAGTMKDHYLVAPGVSVSGPVDGSETEYSDASGTSFAAPMVSGAAALVYQADQSLTSPQIKDILLSTTVDLGETGVDDIYGNGLLDVEAALAPVGLLSIPDGDTTSESKLLGIDTRMTLSPAFGDALASDTSALSNVVALDDYNRPYYVDLSGTVSASVDSTNLRGLLKQANYSDDTLVVGDGLFSLTANLSVEKDESYAHRAALSGEEFVERDYSNTFVLRSNFGPAAVTYAETAPQTLFGVSEGSVSYMGEQAMGNPYLSMSQDTQTVALSSALSGTYTKAGFVSGTMAGTESDMTIGMVETGYTGERGVVALQLGQMSETGTLLGAEASGALGAGSAAVTTILGIDGRYELAKGVSLSGGYHVGYTQVSGDETTLLRNWSGLVSASYGVGVTGADILGKGTMVGLRLSRPLRIESGTVDMSVPTYRDLEHNIQRESVEVGLAPSGNEHSLELAFSKTFRSGMSASANLQYRTDVGHVEGAHETAALMQLEHRF